jgi:hypothetical protein
MGKLNDLYIFGYMMGRLKYRMLLASGVKLLGKQKKEYEKS